MVPITVTYEGDLHCTAVHGPSGAALATDAPTDNHGKGESFSPTDLVATALGTCMLTVMGIAARTHQIDISGTTARVEKDMASGLPRRISKLDVHIHVPRDVSAEDQQRLEAAALTCPVHQSLHPDTLMPIRFSWGAA